MKTTLASQQSLLPAPTERDALPSAMRAYTLVTVTRTVRKNGERDNFHCAAIENPLKTLRTPAMA